MNPVPPVWKSHDRSRWLFVASLRSQMMHVAVETHVMGTHGAPENRSNSKLPDGMTMTPRRATMNPA